MVLAWAWLSSQRYLCAYRCCMWNPISWVACCSSSMILIWKGKSFILEKEHKGGKFESLKNLCWSFFWNAMPLLVCLFVSESETPKSSLETICWASLSTQIFVGWIGGLSLERPPNVSRFSALEESCNFSPPFLSREPEGILLVFWKQVRKEGSLVKKFT